MIADASNLLHGLIGEHLRPPERLNVPDWSDRYRIVLDPSPRPGRWRTEDVPFLREPMLDFTTEGITAVILAFAPQTGKTEFLINCLCHTVDVEPYPVLWVVDSADNARKFAQQRLLPALRGMPRMARHLSPRKWDTKAMSVQFDTCSLNLVGSNSKGQLAMQPVGRLIIDERDKFPESLAGRGGAEAGAADLAYARLGAFGAAARAVEACSPTVESQGIWQRYTQSDQGVYHVPCPRCGVYQLLTFRQLRWEGGDGSQMDDQRLSQHATKVRRSAWYQCAACEGRIESHEKQAIVAAGCWVRSGQEIVRDKAGPLAGGYRVEGQRPDTSVRGYTLSRLYPAWYSFGDVAAAYVELRGDLNQDFVNKWLGEPWRQLGARGDEERISQNIHEAHARMQSIAAAPEHDQAAWAAGERYRKGECPGNAMVMLGAIDVQKEGVWYLVQGFGAREATYCIDWGFVACPEIAGADLPLADIAEHWGLVIHLMRRLYPRAQTAEAMSVHTWVIDTGYRTDEIYRLCRHMGPWVIPVKGQDTLKQPLEFGIVSPDGTPSGPRATERARASGMTLDLMNIKTDLWKDEVFARLSRSSPQMGAWRYPIDIDDDHTQGWELLRQLTSEHRVAAGKSGKRAGRQIWSKRPGRPHNHLWDCAYYLLAAARHLGLEDLGREGMVVNPTNPQRPSENAAPSGPAARPARATGLRQGGMRTG
jgi:phage terminase large subunit GpA-like protein